MVSKLIPFNYKALLISVDSPLQLNDLTDDLTNPWDYLQNLITVIFVLAVIIGLIIVLIRVLAARNRGLQANRSVKTLSGIHFGQNKSLQIVEIGHSLYVIGVGDNVDLIYKIDDVEEISFIKQSLHRNEKMPFSHVAGSIKEWFQERRTVNTRDEVEDVEELLSFEEVFHDKMKRIKEQKNEMEQLLRMQANNERNEQ